MPNNYVEEKISEFGQRFPDSLLDSAIASTPVRLRTYLRESLTSAIIHGLELAEKVDVKSKEGKYVHPDGAIDSEISLEGEALAEYMLASSYNQGRFDTLTSISKIKETIT